MTLTCKKFQAPNNAAQNAPEAMYEEPDSFFFMN